VQRLAAVADEVGELAQVLADQRLAADAVLGEPGLVRLPGRVLLGGAEHPPVGEIEGQLLVAVDDRIRQVAALAAVQAGGAQLGLEVGPRRLQRQHRRAAQHLAVVVQVDEVRRIAVGVMDAPRAL